MFNKQNDHEIYAKLVVWEIVLMCVCFYSIVRWFHSMPQYQSTMKMLIQFQVAFQYPVLSCSEFTLSSFSKFLGHLGKDNLILLTKSETPSWCNTVSRDWPKAPDKFLESNKNVSILM